MKIEIDKAMLTSLLNMGSIIEARDVYTAGHTWRVAQYAERTGQKAGLGDEELFRLALGGLLHDIGKVGIPDSVLLKPGPLTEDEYAVIKTHPLIGRDILREHPLGELVLDVVEHHHEWLDGHGYPEGISQTEVSPRSRIMAIADVFDAMTSTRPYRKGLPVDKAISTIQDEAGKQFDSSLVAIFVSLHEEGALDEIIGHSYQARPLIACPMCGPTIAASHDTREGDKVCCRSCEGLFTLHQKGETLVAEVTGQKSTAEDRRPIPEWESIHDIVAQSPATVTV